MKWLIYRLVLFMLLTFGVLLSGQSRIISEHIRDLNESGFIFEEIEVFDKKEITAGFTSKYVDVLSHVTLLHLEESALNKIISDAPEFLSLSVPFKNELIPLELYRQSCLSDSFYVIDQSGNRPDYTAGEYYRGIIAGNPESIAAISFFSNNVMGIVSAGNYGNITIGKSTDKQDFLSYSDMDLLIDPGFECEIEFVDTHNQNMEKMVYSNDTYEPVHKHSCIKGYYELAHNIFLNNEGDITETLNWFTGLHNNVSALYANDGISLMVKTVKVWTEPDPYEGIQFAQEFKQQLSDFDGDFAHLIRTPSLISTAFINGLCTEFIYAISNVNMNYGQVPIFSSAVQTIAHENGHVFGLPHTHACNFWNNEGDPIDGCGTLAGSPGCDGPIPENGGTIMSYCGKLLGVGINFANGFGGEPAMMLKNSIDSWDCLDKNCSEGPGYNCVFTVNEIVEPISRMKMIFTDNISTASAPGTSPIEFFTDMQIYLQRGKDFEITVEGNTNGNYTNSITVWVDWNRNGIWDEDEKTNVGLLSNSNGEDGKSVSAVVHVPDDAPLGRNRMRIIKSRGDFVQDACSPIDYGQAEDYELRVTDRKIVGIKLFSDPPEGGQSRFYEKDTDEMFYYEGESVSVYATPNEGYAFTSWSEEGEIVNSIYYKYSFIAGNDRVLTANFQKIKDSQIYVYPNPFSDKIKIETLEIKEIKLFDIAGRLIISEEIPFLDEYEINTRSLEKGIYILSVVTRLSKENFKLIKE